MLRRETKESQVKERIQNFCPPKSLKNGRFAAKGLNRILDTNL